MNMKKIVLAVLFSFIVSFAFAENNKILGFDIGLCSGIPFYGSDEVVDANESIFDEDFRRIIIGADADVSISVGKPLKMVFGVDLMADIIWCGNNYSNHLDYAFWGGIKVYPGFGGFNASLAYTLGCRTDFVNNEVNDTVCRSSAWGNGFRIGVEYDFHYNSDFKCLPSIGTYYRFMPRGDKDYDNILAVYVNATF